MDVVATPSICNDRPETNCSYPVSMETVTKHNVATHRGNESPEDESDENTVMETHESKCVFFFLYAHINIFTEDKQPTIKKPNGMRLASTPTSFAMEKKP